MTCRFCGSDYITETLVSPDEGIPHYSRLRCSNCDKTLGWGKKPDSKSRPANHSELIKKYSKGFCTLCLRPSKGLCMNAHHIIEYKDGGLSSEDNIQIVCNACHGIIHHVRNYCRRGVDIA